MGVAPKSKGKDVSTGSLGHLRRSSVNNNASIGIVLHNVSGEGKLCVAFETDLQGSLSLWLCHREHSSAANLLSTGQEEEKKSGRRERCHSVRPDGTLETLKKKWPTHFVSWWLLELCPTCFRQSEGAGLSTLSLCLEHHFPLLTDTASVNTSHLYTDP